MSRKTFLVLLAILGLLHIGSAGLGLTQDDGADSSSDPDDVEDMLEERFGAAKRFGARTMKNVDADELTCEPRRILRHNNDGRLYLEFTEDNDECELKIGPNRWFESRGFQLHCPRGAELGITIVTTDEDGDETDAFYELPNEETRKTLHNGAWVVQTGDAIQIDCDLSGLADPPDSNPKVCRVSLTSTPIQ